MESKSSTEPWWSHPGHFLVTNQSLQSLRVWCLRVQIIFKLAAQSQMIEVREQCPSTINSTDSAVCTIELIPDNLGCSGEHNALVSKADSDETCSSSAILWWEYCLLLFVHKLWNFSSAQEVTLGQVQHEILTIIIIILHGLYSLTHLPTSMDLPIAIVPTYSPSLRLVMLLFFCYIPPTKTSE